MESFEQKELCTKYGKAPAAQLATKGNREQKDRVHMLKSIPDFETDFSANSSTDIEFQTLLPTVGRKTLVIQAHPVLTSVGRVFIEASGWPQLNTLSYIPPLSKEHRHHSSFQWILLSTL